MEWEWVGVSGVVVELMKLWLVNICGVGKWSEGEVSGLFVLLVLVCVFCLWFILFGNEVFFMVGYERVMYWGRLGSDVEVRGFGWDFWLLVERV